MDKPFLFIVKNFIIYFIVNRDYKFLTKDDKCKTTCTKV